MGYTVSPIKSGNPKLRRKSSSSPVGLGYTVKANYSGNAVSQRGLSLQMVYMEEAGDAQPLPCSPLFSYRWESKAQYHKIRLWGASLRIGINLTPEL